jgi:aldehyde:ferredoxin oxidoreductase
MSDEVKVGTEDIEKVLELAVKNIKLGQKVAEGGVNAADLAHAGELVSNVKELVEFIASKPNIAEEIKDIDFAEAVALAQKAYDGFKEVVE